MLPCTVTLRGIGEKDMTEEFLTMRQWSKQLGFNYAQVQWHQKRRPLPPVAVIRGSLHGHAYTEEQVRWYVENIPQGRGRRSVEELGRWSTPYDGQSPVEYVGVSEICQRSGRANHRLVVEAAREFGIEPDVRIGLMYGWVQSKAQQLLGILDSQGRRRPATDNLLNRGGIAKLLGVSRDTVYDYKLPQPDRLILTGAEPIPVWYQGTVEKWHANRNKRQLRKSAEHLAGAVEDEGKNNPAA